ncbi:cytochrome b2 [Tothia fuscella]|uniref:L-lactate dehydrogenase (cytochrome) n=1 Tax=Tothia fuscella TaxID=1048955 RepID=A0A9P4TXY8_9PEZI|nr:cytochrome b2 [Tothia fuscella]
MATGRKISVEELTTHSKPDDVWISINGVIWDVTDFAPKHPGGAVIILEYAGQDATKAYNEVHGPSLVAKHLDSSKSIGNLDKSTVTEEWKSKQASNIESSRPSANNKPPLEAILNTYDFELASQKSLSAKSWAFIYTGANDLITKDANIDWWRRMWFRPRVLTGVKDIDVSTSILGQKYKVPFFNAPSALAKLSHPEGELVLAKGLIEKGSTIIVCNNASFSFPEIMEVVPKNHPVFYQLYVNKDRAVTEKLVREVSSYNPQAIMVTVDLPVVGKREHDERLKTEATYKAPKSFQSQNTKGDKKGSGLARATGSFIDSNLRWEDIRWLQTITSVPIFVKGIQSAMDAKKALEYGCKGIYISNHGGRAADTAQPSLLTMLEIQANCPEVMEKMEVFIDGGIRRGTDILKAICLGASGVCLGRPFLFAVGYGQDGVEHAVDLLKDELETAMQMIGITSLSQAHPGLLNTGDLDKFVYRGDSHPWARKIVRKVKL